MRVIITEANCALVSRYNVYNQRFSERLNKCIRYNHSRCKGVHRGDALIILSPSRAVSLTHFLSLLLLSLSLSLLSIVYNIFIFSLSFAVSRLLNLVISTSHCWVTNDSFGPAPKLRWMPPRSMESISHDRHRIRSHTCVRVCVRRGTCRIWKINRTHRNCTLRRLRPYVFP